MRLRCPESEFKGVGRLAGFRWIINSRGYANIVTSRDPQSAVFGLIYSLTPVDVAALDLNEGVPYAYTKEMMEVEFWKSPYELSNISRNRRTKVDLTEPAESRDVLVYIDRLRLQVDKPKAEYIYRMNMGIADAMEQGVPVGYVIEHVRPFIPSSSSSDMEDLAQKQAANFVEEETH